MFDDYGFNFWDVADAWQNIVREASVEDPSVLPVDHFFHQGHADALRDTALDLALN
jgi:hypothetical protein